MLIHNDKDHNVTQKLSQTFTKAKAWVAGNKAKTAGITAGAVLILCLAGVGIAYSCGAFQAPQSAEPEATAEETAQTADLSLNVTADAGWDENSTPAIAHIEGKDSDVDFYHAVTPDAEGNKGTSTVTLEEGDYTVSFVSPVNSDGSAYDIYDTGDPVDVTVDADAEEAPAVDCPMTQIPADQVTDEMLQDIIDQTKDAVENGDETLKGDAGKDILDKLEGNVSANPNASDETKQEATDADTEVDVNGTPEATTPSGTTDNSGSASTGNTGASTGNSGSSGSTSSGSSSTGGSSSQPAHQHVWKNHTATKQVWVSNMVTVPDYETQQVFSHYLYVFSADGYSTTDINAVKSHSVELAKQGLSTNYSNVPQYTEQKVQVGSHQEDHGHYETQSYTDYQYCDCGATR